MPKYAPVMMTHQTLVRKGYGRMRAQRKSVFLSFEDGYFCLRPLCKTDFALADLKSLLGNPDHYQKSYVGCTRMRGGKTFSETLPTRIVYWKIDTQTYIRLHADPTPLAQIVLGVLPPWGLVDLLGDD